MNSIEILKNELQEQKSAIESKGGVVSVLNTNVSPAEITAGIKSIQVADFEQTTAVESDVLLGKTFYNNNGILVSGNLVVPDNMESNQQLLDYILYGKESDPYPNLEIHLPDFTTHIKEFMLYNCKCKADVYINQNLLTVGEAAFHQGVDTNIHDLDKATNLSYVGINSFRATKGVDLSKLPSGLTHIDNFAFSDCAKYCNGIVVPPNLTTVGSYTFHCSSLTTVDYVDLSQAPYLEYGLHFIENIKCYNDLVIPEGVTSLTSYFNYNGSIKTIILPSTLTKLNTNTFNVKDSTPLEDMINESVVFFNPTPPTINSTSFCLRWRNTTQSIKFFVPDEAVSTYIAAPAYAPFKNYIYPMSERT